MPDLGHEVSFGVFLPNPASRPGAVIRLAKEAESAGLDLLGVQDHPYNPDLLDTWTLLSHLSAATERIRLFPDVACVPLRPPAVLARAAASLDLLSGGRVELGLGAGYFRDAIAGMGAAELSSGDAVTALDEAVEIVRAIWDADGPITRDGTFHSVRGAAPGPRPAHPIEIWIGSYRPRMLELTARRADGWVPSQAYAGFNEIGALSARLDRLLVDAGRAPSEVRRIYNVNGRFTMTGGGFLDGTPEQWAEQLTELVLGQGFSSFVLGPTGDIVTVLATFAQEVAPDVRERVAAARASGGRPMADLAASTSGAVQDSTHEPYERISVAAMLAGDGGRERSGSWGDAGGLAVADRPRVARRVTDPDAPTPAVGSPGGPAGPGMRDNYRDLVAIHDHLRSELVQIQAAVAQVAQGDLEPATARSLIATMTLRQNHWTLGSFCASYCRIVTIHHAVEDAHMFPALARSDASLGEVLARLEAEHVVIAEVLDRFDRALVALVREPGLDRTGKQAGEPGPEPITRLCDELSDLLLSHLAYEEDELAEGLRRMTEPI